MNFVLNIIFMITFLGMLVISTKVILDSNFDHLFKQGKTNSIRVAYVIVILIVSFFVAYTFRELSNTIYNLISK